LAPLPQGVPGEGPDCNFLWFWADPGPDPGGNEFLLNNFGPKRS
jgi:hypothetical protein